MCTKITRKKTTAYISEREREKEKSPGVVFMAGSYLLLLLTIVGRDYESEHFVCVYELCFLKHKITTTPKKRYFMGSGLVHDPEVI